MSMERHRRIPHQASIPKAGPPPHVLYVATALLFGVCVAACVATLATIAWTVPTAVRLRRVRSGAAINTTSEETGEVERAIVMSCPVGPSHTNHGNWKPRNMARGVEAVVQQMIKLRSALPLFFVYYGEERDASEPFCRSLAARYAYALHVRCVQIDEKFPHKQYGYAKIFAIRRVPARLVLWVDCDVFPVRDPMPLFDDAMFRQTGAMYWPDSRDHFDESKLSNVLNTSTMRELFPINSWWVAQGFDSGLLLINRTASASQLRTLSNIARFKHHALLRRVSLGDKDLFHIAWMIHAKNFTLVPYIGETGYFEPSVEMVTQNIAKRIVQVPVERLHWKMSSQVKYGRDGLPYALHQLHRIPKSTFGNAVRQLQQRRGGRRENDVDAYVEPVYAVRKDLRVGGDGVWTTARRRFGSFIEDVEGAFLHDRARRLRTFQDAVEVGIGRGLHLADGFRLLGQHVRDMDRAWSRCLKAEEEANKVVQKYLRTLQ